MAGPAVESALAFLGPPGAVAGPIVGAAVTHALNRLGSELDERVLGPRQQTRIAAALAFAATEVQDRLERNEQPRSDGFFETDPMGRRSAEELLEGMLLQAGDAYEERKVKHLGWMYAGLVFERIDPAYAHLLLRIAERLTYRGLVVLAVFDTADRQKLILLDAARTEGRARSSDTIIAELDELGQQSVLGVAQEGGIVGNVVGTIGGGDWRGILLAKTRPMPMGVDLIRLMRLDRIRPSEMDAVLGELGAPL